MLELRPNCELCDKDLPPHAEDARICSYECTYCAQCVETVLQNVCPTCGGNFTPRPFRPAKAWRSDKTLGLANQPARTDRVNTTRTPDQIAEMVNRIKDIAPKDR